MLVLVGFLPNEVWMLGVVLARGLNEDSKFIVFAHATATAILTGLVGKPVIFAAGGARERADGGAARRDCARARRLRADVPLGARGRRRGDARHDGRRAGTRGNVRWIWGCKGGAYW